jgi:hypothetical protein
LSKTNEYIVDRLHERIRELEKTIEAKDFEYQVLESKIEVDNQTNVDMMVAEVILALVSLIAGYALGVKFG